MKKSLQKKLLSIINENKSLQDLIKKQVSYGDIVDELINLVKQGYIEKKDEGFVLTNQGFNFLTEKNDFEIIQPLEKYRLEKKLSLDDIYVPNYIKEC